MSSPIKLIRITTVPISLDKLLEGQLNYMGTYYEIIAVSSEKEYLERVGKRENVATFHLEMTRKITPFKDLIAVVKLYSFFKKNKPLIVHTHTPKAGIVGMLASKLAGVPNRLHTVAGLPLLEATGIKKKVLNLVEKLTYACATNVYPNSICLSGIIQENNFCNPTKLKVLGNGSSNGIDTSFFNSSLFLAQDNTLLKAKLAIENTDFVFVFVGRMVADKGINELIAAFSRFSSESKNCKLLLVGPLETELDPLKESTLKEIESNPAIISVGYQNDVRPYFAISNCLVFPSYREGFPNVVMQAGAMDLPCIVSDINGCNEIIIHNNNGLIIPVKNENAIFEAIKLMLSDTDLYNSMKMKSRKMIVSRFEQKFVWKAILEEYQKIQQNV
jgi:glycosyltransferase involved in cell wall biosynthesis